MSTPARSISCCLLHGSALRPASAITSPVQLVDDRLGNDLSVDTGSDAQFFIVFITSNAGQVISSCVEEQGVQMGSVRCPLSAARPDAAFGIPPAALLRCCWCCPFRWSQRCAGHLQRIRRICPSSGKSESTDEGGYRQLSVFINTHIENVVGVGLIFKPCAAVWNHCGRQNSSLPALSRDTP